MIKIRSHPLSLSIAVLLLSAASVPLRAADEIIDGVTVTVPGTQSSPWDIDGNLIVGNTTTGSLTIGAGGQVSNVDGYVGAAPGSSGSVTVSGAGALWTITQTTSALNTGLFIGKEGAGTLDILNGGKVVVATVGTSIGFAGTHEVPAGSGIVTVSGEGSELTTAYLILGRGDTGTGQLTISNQGKVTATSTVTIGGSSSAGGRLIVTGADSILTSGTINMSSAPNSSFTVTDGASVYGSGSFSVGSGNTATVSGSTLEIATNLSHSGGGSSILLENGATTTVGGNVTLSNTGGTITVTGTGTTLSITGNLAFSNGSGLLAIKDGGVVTATGNLTLGTASGTSTPKVSVETGGKLSTTGAAVIGGASTSGAAAAVTVTGAGSEWNSATDITVGNGGTTTNPGNHSLTIADAGKVSVNGGTGKITLNNNKAGTATLNIGAGGTAGTLQASEVTTVGTGTFLSGQVNFNHTDNIAFSAKLTGTRLGVAKFGGGTTILTGTNTYALATAVNGGALLVNGSLGNTAVTVADGATFGGSGSVAGPVTLALGAKLAPGSEGIGEFSTGVVTLAAGASYLWEIGEVSGTAGTSWDLLSVTGSLSLPASESQPFTIAFASPDAPGLLGEFNPLESYDFVIASATGGITGFDAEALAFDFSALPTLNTGGWSAGLSGDSKELHLTHTAVPEPAAAAFLGLAALTLAGRRRYPRIS